jgi:hypothetical protein
MQMTFDAENAIISVRSVPADVLVKWLLLFGSAEADDFWFHTFSLFYCFFK